MLSVEYDSCLRVPSFNVPLGDIQKDGIKKIIENHMQLHCAAKSDLNFYLLHNGKIFNDTGIPKDTVYVIPCLKGGKGGFGSMLRAIGAQIEKTTNREACRDLSGRRLRDINEEKRLKKWIAEQAEREKEAAEKKKRKLKKMCVEPKHEFSDPAYDKARSEMVEKVHDAVEEGLKQSNLPPEPSTSEAKKSEKKKKKIKGSFWVDDLDELDETDSEGSEAESPKKKMKVV